MSNVIMRIESIIARIFLVAMVSLVFFAGLLRWFGYPLVWSMDVAQLLFVWTSFIGADMAMRKRGLIAVDLFVRWMSPRFRAIADLLTGGLILAFLITMAVLGYKLTVMNLEREFGDSGISYGFVTGAVPAGCLLLASTLAGQIIETIISLGGIPKLVFSVLRSKQEAIASLAESEL